MLREHLEGQVRKVNKVIEELKVFQADDGIQERQVSRVLRVM